jgi:hypothetical protein
MKSLFGKKIGIYLLLAVLIFTLDSCGIGYLVRGTARKKYTKENKVIPPDFIENDEVLLILKWEQGSYDKYAMKAFDKFYTGKKEYVTMNQLLSEEYADAEKYRYVFSQGPGDLTMYEGKSYSYTFEGSRPFHIYDRLNNEFYRSNITSGFFYRIMQAYAMNLEKERIKK